jgi:hypothetical protein
MSSASSKKRKDNAMADPTPKSKLPVHPLLANLTQSGQSPESTIKFSGYVGQASREGQVRLYHSLEDPSHYIEFDESGVVHSDPAPADLAPNNGLSVWVKASTPVRWTCEHKNAKSLAMRIARMASRRGVSGPPGVF